MFSWNAIRTFCVTLLCLPLAHLVILISRDVVTALDSSPTTWQSQVDAYTRQDAKNIVLANPIVVVGGRRAAIWRDLERIVTPGHVIVRSLGDATINDLTYYYDRLISRYLPKVVVLLPGNSEFRIRDNKSTSELVAAIKNFIAADDAPTGTRLLYIFIPIKTILYPGDHKTIDDAHEELAHWARRLSYVRIIDPNPILATAGARPDAAFFRSNGVHLNDNGYERLGFLLRHQLSDDYPEEYAKPLYNSGTLQPQSTLELRHDFGTPHQLPLNATSG
ncbi:MAG: hypothetical protein ACK5ME_02570 [Parahaliea sp.]